MKYPAEGFRNRFRRRKDMAEFRTVPWERYPHPRGKNGRGHISHVRIQKKSSGTSSSPEASIKTAATYSPTVTQYHRRDKA